MKALHLVMAGVVAASLSAGLVGCDSNVVDDGPAPPAATMTFKQGARYEFNSYQTDPTTKEKMTATERTRTWTLVNTSGSVQGRSNVAIYVDSVVAGGPIFVVADSVFLQQQSGTNDIYRYASLAPELDFSGTSVINVDLGKQWMHEARLNATAAHWFVGESADTVQMSTLNVPGLQGVKVAVTDSAIGSGTESLTIGGTSYTATKTTHKLELSISAIVTIPILGATPIKLQSTSLERITWTIPSLGVIAKEQREGRVLDVAGTTFSGVTIPGFTLPVPGYISTMTKVLVGG